MRVCRRIGCIWSKGLRRSMEDPCTSEEDRELEGAVVETVEGMERARGDYWREGSLLRRG
jgi:hypothetical protein